MLLRDYRAQHNLNLIFRHQSPHKLDVLKPLSYRAVAKQRAQDYDAGELGLYMKDRKESEAVPHNLLSQVLYPKDCSFLYATVVGYHKMESPQSYPGFTYYFTLSEKEIENCIFFVSFQSNSIPTKGMIGLRASIDFWKKNEKYMKPTYDDILGQVDPRIEVLIPFEVKPFGYVVEEEGRKKD